MKKKTIYFTGLLAVLICGTTVFCSQVFANANGGGGHGGGNTTGTCNNTFCSGFENTYESGDYGSAYKIQLVYYPGSGSSWNIIKEAIIYSGDNQMVKDKIGTRNEQKLFGGTAQSFAQKIHGVVYSGASDAEITNWFDRNDSANFRALAQEMGASEEQLSLESEKERRINSHGYRIIAQKLVAFNGGFKTRKELASQESYSYGQNCLYGIWDVTPGSCVGTFRDLHTVEDDIGISAPSSLGNQYGVELYWGYDRLKRTIENSTSPSGSGYGIYEFENPYENQYDYTLDAACVNCDNKLSNASYVIQDTTSWKAITKSRTAKSKKVAEYYYKNGYDTYCREEISIQFPNGNNTINVQSGRYFTVGLTQDKIGNSPIPNFGDMKVTRKVECSGGNAQAYARQVLNASETGTDQDSSVIDRGTGTVSLNYKETYNESKYNKNNINLIPECGGLEPISYNSEGYAVSGYAKTCTYTLNDFVYRYVKKDGESVYRANAEEKKKLEDLGVANFPISFKNHPSFETNFGSTIGSASSANKDNVAATIHLVYKPSKSAPSLSKLYTAYEESNSYLKVENAKNSENIYSKALKAGAVSTTGISQGGLKPDEFTELSKSTCVKLYCNGTSCTATNGGQNVKSCMEARTNNKIGSGTNNCIAKNNLNSNDQKVQYICPIKFGNNVCAIKDGKYYYNNQEITKEKYIEIGCNPDNPPDEPGDGNVCAQVNGKYYINYNTVTKTGKAVSAEVYKKTCDCGVYKGKYYIQNKAVDKATFDKLCPGPDEKDCPPDDVCCITGLCSNIIYRPIDLVTSFPGRTGNETANRLTGANWCHYNASTKVLDCSSRNATVTNYILNNRQVNDNELYYSGTRKPLYTVTLDAQKMRNIRVTNDRSSYSDFTLNCKNGRQCHSTFLDNLQGVTGTCSSNSADFNACANKTAGGRQ